MKSAQTDLVVSSPSAVAPTDASPLASTMTMILAAAKDPACDVGKLEKLLAMHERMETRQAEQHFIVAFNKLQLELSPIVASSEISNRGKYERYEDVMEHIRRPLQSNGFVVSFGMDYLESPLRVVVTCTLSHIAGHSRANSFTVRVSGKADSETQADCKAATTAKRNALLQALNIVIRQNALADEDDPRMDGAFIDAATADELERRIALTNSDARSFLKLAGTDKFSTVTRAKYEVLDQLLARKEAGK